MRAVAGVGSDGLGHDQERGWRVPWRLFLRERISIVRDFFLKNQLIACSGARLWRHSWRLFWRLAGAHVPRHIPTRSPSGQSRHMTIRRGLG